MKTQIELLKELLGRYTHLVRTRGTLYTQPISRKEEDLILDVRELLEDWDYDSDGNLILFPLD